MSAQMITRMGTMAGLLVTEMQLSQPANFYPDSLNGNFVSPWADSIEISLSGKTNDWKVVETFRKLATNPLTALYSADNEFLCIYCQSPNPLHHRHCSQCGAPRGFIIGGEHV